MKINKFDGIVNILKELDTHPSKFAPLLLRAKTNCSRCGSELIATKIEDRGYSEYATTFTFTCPNKKFWNGHNDNEKLYLPLWNYDKVKLEWAAQER